MAIFRIIFARHSAKTDMYAMTAQKNDATHIASLQKVFFVSVCAQEPKGVFDDTPEVFLFVLL